MTPEEFGREMAGKIQALKRAIDHDIPRIVESIALEYVDDNFRNQAFEGERWKDSNGTILVKTGRLRRGFESDARPEQVTITNDVPYAKVHNEGFEGDVNVPQHYRSVYVRNGRGRRTRTSNKVLVKAHKKKMKMPKRQFAPITGTDTPTLNKGINEAITKKFTDILTPNT